MAAGLCLILAASGLVGCAASPDRSATPPAAQTAGGRLPGGAPSQAAPLAPEVTRQVISTATLRIELRDVGGATARAAQLAVESGGFVAESQESGSPDDRRAQLTLKVPGDRFDGLVTAIAALGAVRSKQVSTDDVTEQVVDLDARLGAARAGADRLQQLIAKAATVTEVVGVEAELVKRTAEIESLEGRLRVLRDKVDLATVSVTLSPPQPAADDELPGFLSGLRGGWRALRATGIVGSAFLGALLPWLVPLALLVLAVRLGWRRWRRTHTPRPRPMPPMSATSGAPRPAAVPPAQPVPPPPDQAPQPPTGPNV